MAAERRTTENLHLAAILLVYAGFVARFWFVCDDAFISFRYARNWAVGFGLVFNPGEFPPVEGYSNLLWVFLSAALEMIGASPPFIVPWGSALCGAVLLWRVQRVLWHRLHVDPLPALAACLTLAASPAVGVWATSGLATMPQTLLTFLLAELWLFEKEEPGEDWAVPLLIASALCLLRTDGVVLVALVATSSLLPVWNTPARTRHLHALAQALLPVGAIWLAYHGWRYSYYGTVRHHIVLTKVALGPRSLVRGVQYVTLFWLTCVTPLVSLMAGAWLVREADRRWLAVFLIAAAVPIYAALVGGDFMPFGRLLVPGLPFAALLLGGTLHRLQFMELPHWVVPTVAGTLVLTQAASAFDVHLIPDAVRRLAHMRLSDKIFLSEAERWANQRENTKGFVQRGQALAEVADPTDAVVAAAVGAVGYYSGLEVMDQHGLVTREVGLRRMQPGPLTRSPGHDKHVEPTYFVKYEPRFLYARAVQGRLAAGRMKDTLEQWSVDRSVMDRYVPDFYEVTPLDEQRTFLLVVRLREGDEDPAEVWRAFPERRRALNATLRAFYGEPEEPESDG